MLNHLNGRSRPILLGLTLFIGLAPACTPADRDSNSLADGGGDSGVPDAGSDAGVADAGSDAGVADAGSDVGVTDAGSDAGTSLAALAAGSGFLAANWSFPQVGASSPMSFSVVWSLPGGNTNTVNLPANVRKYEIESMAGVVVPYGSSVTVTITANYPNGIASKAVTSRETMLAAAPPNALNTGPRLTNLTVNPVNSNLNGYNQTADGSGIVRYTGVKFTGHPQINGSQGGPTQINGYVFTDCEFTFGIYTEGSVLGAPGIVFDHCVAGDISTISNPRGSAVRSNFIGVGGSPLQLFRHDPWGAQGATLTSTPWSFTDCAFKCPYPTPTNGAHFEAVHVRGAKDVTFTRCSYDLGWNRLPDGSLPAITSNIYIEGGYGGNDNILFSSGWHYGFGPYYGLVVEGTNVSIINSRMSRNGGFNDLSHDGSNKPGPSVSIQDNGGQVTSGLSLLGNVWDVDGTSLGAAFLARPSGNNGMITWY